MKGGWIVECRSCGYGIWDMGYGIWDMGYGIWDMGYGIWDMGYGIWDMNMWGASKLSRRLWHILLFWWCKR